MALVNGGTYFVLSATDYNTLHEDDDYATIYQDLLAGFDTITIGTETYYYWPHGSFNADGLLAAINGDTDGDLAALHSIELETAVYFSGVGFQFQ